MAKKSYCGRSMVEMLGVLAIIGVLSIGGMWGYQKAMTLYRTNNLIEDVRLAGFVVMDSLFDILPDDDTGMDMAGLFDQKTPYQFTAFAEKENTFEIMTQDIPYPVCEEVKKRKVEWLEEIKANGISNICNKDDINEVSFFFNTELNGNTEQESEQCRTDNDCPTTKPYCRSGICSKCETGLQLNNGSCAHCPTTTVGNTTKTSCHACGNNYLYFFNSHGGLCGNCQTTHETIQLASKAECLRCDNRCWDNTQQLCLHSIKGSDFINPDGTCNYDCPTGKYATSASPNGIDSGSAAWLTCSACPAIDGYGHGLYTNATYCHSCGDQYMWGKKWCYGCQSGYPYAKEVSPDECKRCTNRYYNTETQQCLICPSGKHADDTGTKCI